ncbi:hypothetical protein CU669_19120 [Paramagnetospirillum kuznetsovii]|uniref:Uncharacterized protein n=1 Tax=Paramagnetospirillum kuznetsovii TaxID=2053833 RepID=A0A364NT60_9PROT|nr:hypothetical protein [Paramagnetospirillum kuznetsovii]RAU20279.1 hypothetical protein CU669_19120 [Paramagnetospirillum kuznetsovii]
MTAASRRSMVAVLIAIADHNGPIPAHFFEGMARSSERRAFLHHLSPVRKKLWVVYAKRGSVTATQFAWLVGYRPPCNGRLAVSKALRGLTGDACDINPNVVFRGRRVILGRLPPKDEWASAHWYANEASS